MEQEKQMAEYFRQKSSYKRLLKGIRNKYISLGEIKGNVVISNPDKAEKQALSGLMKKDYSRNFSISINLAKLQKRIEESKFAGASLEGIIKEYFNEEIVTKKENKKEYEEEIAKFFENILAENANTSIYNKLKEIIKSKNEIYYNLKKHYNKDKQELKIALLNVTRGLNNLPKEKVRIPVFASNVMKNPHGLDRNTLCGKIFIMLLCYVQNLKVPKNTEELSELYYKNNLLIDDVSNMVLCKNINGFVNVGEYKTYDPSCILYQEHEGLHGFYKYNEPIYLNLYNLANISFIKKEKYKKVVVMENPAVFMEVAESTVNKDFPLICTYGQVKLSGLVLLDMMADAEYEIYYSGDIDPEGIQIADKLKKRYKGKLHFLGFDVNTYIDNLSNVELSQNRLKKLDGISSKELEKVCKEVKRLKVASYEEQNIDKIVEFIDAQ